MASLMSETIDKTILDILKTRQPVTRKEILDAFKTRLPEAYAQHKHVEALNDISRRLNAFKKQGNGVVQKGTDLGGILLWTWQDPVRATLAFTQTLDDVGAPLAGAQSEMDVGEPIAGALSGAEPEDNDGWQPEPETTPTPEDDWHERFMREIFDRHAETFKAMETYVEMRLASRKLTDGQRAALQTAIAFLDVTDRLTGETNAAELRGLLEAA